MTLPLTPATLNDRCPRCGGAFHCGAADAIPCPCGQITLTDAHRAALRATGSTCLCLRCLADIAGGAPVVLPTDGTGAR
jgi:Cysteine-rich CWC